MQLYSPIQGKTLVKEKNISHFKGKPVYQFDINMKQNTVNNSISKNKTMDQLFYNDISQLIYELNFYQVELETQNECLLKTQYGLEEALKKYIDLYNQSPHGYFILNESCLILDTNTSGAALLDIPKKTLINRCFSRYIIPEHQILFSQYRQHALKQEKSQRIEIKIKRWNNSCFYARLESSIMRGSDCNKNQLLISVTQLEEDIK